VKNSATYDPNEKYVFVTVSNIGRRPEHISLVVAASPSEDPMMFSDTFFNPNEIVEGGQPRQYLAKQSTMGNLQKEWAGIFALVRTTSGRQYRSKFLRVSPKGAEPLTFVQRIRLRIRSRFRNRWAFRRRYLE
jgi:hypothetical protein